MGLKKLSEETISQDFTSDAHLLVAQTEEVDGDEVNVVRRVPMFGEGKPMLYLSAELEDLNSNQNLFNSNGNTMSRSVSDGVATFTPYSGQTSFSIVNAASLSAGKYIAGFKFKFTKLRDAAPELTRVRVAYQAIVRGQSTYKYFEQEIAWGTWVSFAETAEMKINNIYLLMYFADFATSSDFKLEVKELYIYDLDEVDPHLIDVIKKDQDASYASGTVTYTAQMANTDMTLTENGMAADAKVVGDALKNLKVITITDPNDDGNIVIELS